MRKVKQRIFEGAVCEQRVFQISDRVRNIRKAEPREPRKDTPEEREQHKLAISKRLHTQIFNANFSPTSLYATLTFDRDNEIHSPEEARYIRDLYVRRLKYAYPKAVIAIYYGRGKATSRYHLHIVAEGIPEEFLKKQWIYGKVDHCEHLRKHCFYNHIDHGQDYKGLAEYLWGHWRPEFGGHRWKMTRNARRPEKETPTECKREYTEDKPPRAPKGFALVEARATEYGYLYFRYVRIPEDGFQKGKSAKRQRAKGPIDSLVNG